MERRIKDRCHRSQQQLSRKQNPQFAGFPAAQTIVDERSQQPYFARKVGFEINTVTHRKISRIDHQVTQKLHDEIATNHIIAGERVAAHHRQHPGLDPFTLGCDLALVL